MNAHSTDLVSLAAELRAIDLETDIDLRLALRKAKRPRRSARSAKGAETRRQRLMAGLKIINPVVQTGETHG